MNPVNGTVQDRSRITVSNLLQQHCNLATADSQIKLVATAECGIFSPFSPERKQMEKKPLDQSYNAYCSACGFERIHRASTTTLCPSCYQALVGSGENPHDYDRMTLTDKINEESDKLEAAMRGNQDIVHFSSGAVRGSGSLPFHLITPQGLLALAATFGEGAEKYSSYNNLKGFPLSNLFDHAFLHLLQFWWGDTSEDHLSHALWNIHQMLMQQSAEDGRYEKLDDRPGVGLLTPAEVESYKDLMNSIISKLKEGK